MIGKVRLRQASLKFIQPPTQPHSLRSGTLRGVHPIPCKEYRGCDGGMRRTPIGQSGSVRGLKLVLAKWRCLAPPVLG